MVPSTGNILERGHSFLTRHAFIRNVGSTFATNVILLPVVILTSALVARTLGTEGKGFLTLVLLIPGLLSLIFGAGLGIANVYFTGSGKIPFASLSRNSMGFGLLMWVLSVALLAIADATGLLTKLLPDLSPATVFLTLLILPSTLMISYLNSLLLGRQRIQTINGITIAQGLASLILVSLLVVWMGRGLNGAVWAYIGAGAITLGLSAVFVGKEGGDLRPILDRPTLGPMLRFGLKGQVGNMLQFFNYRLDVFVVNYFLGGSAVGIYSVSVALAELLWQLPNAVSFVIFPKASASKAGNMNRFTPRVFAITLGLTFVGALGLALVGRHLIVWIYGADFAAGYGPLLALLPGVVLLGGGKVLTNEVAGRGYPQYNSINSAIALVLTLALDLLLIPSMGIMGAAVASSIAYTTIFAMSILFYIRVSRQESL